MGRPPSGLGPKRSPKYPQVQYPIKPRHPPTQTRLPHADYVLKVDDDAYVWWPAMLELLLPPSPGALVVVGRECSRDRLLIRG